MILMIYANILLNIFKIKYNIEINEKLSNNKG